MKFHADSFDLFHQEWALLTAGNGQHYNTMTISWGGLGTLWGKPVATVYVKPIRYTHEFLETSDYFTISFYSEKYRPALQLLGTLSGRDSDKVAQAALTPRLLDNAVTFDEADVTLVCKKIYRQDMDPAQMPSQVVSAFYASEAAHTMYVGEVIAIVHGATPSQTWH